MIPRTPTDRWVAEKIGVSPDELTPDKLREWQLKAFRDTAEYAKKNSRFYTELLRGIDVSELCSYEDIKALPFTSESDLAGNEWRFQCVSQSEVSRVVTVPTTGTGGRIKRLAFTRSDQKSALDFILTGFTTMCAPGDRMLVMMSGGTPGSIGDLVKHAMGPYGVEVSIYGAVTDIEAAYAAITEMKPNVIVGMPAQTAALAAYGRRFGSPEREYIRAVLLSADDIPDSVCERLRKLWNCNIFRHYGMTEMCIAGGVECEGASGYHLRACDILFEIADADAEGFGEVVITTLHREAMPLIRYRTGDIGRMTAEKCPCGSVLPRIECLRGRKNNCVEISGKKLYLSDIADAVFIFDEAMDFSCAVADENRLIIKVFTLEGKEIGTNELCERLGVAAEIEMSRFLSFPQGYDLKKRIERV